MTPEQEQQERAEFEALQPMPECNCGWSGLLNLNLHHHDCARRATWEHNCMVTHEYYRRGWLARAERAHQELNHEASEHLITIDDRDRAQDALQKTHIALGGDGEWVAKLYATEAGESGDLCVDVPHIAKEIFQEACAAQERADKAELALAEREAQWQACADKFPAAEKWCVVAEWPAIPAGQIPPNVSVVSTTTMHKFADAYLEDFLRFMRERSGPQPIPETQEDEAKR